MAVAAQAALLDELMGKGRNVSLSEAKAPHWSDDDSCKYFLAGLCPNDLFNNTKDDLGPCEKVHDDFQLECYHKSKRYGKMNYEEKLCSYFRDMISMVESRIRRGENRLQKNGNLVHSFYNCEREEVLQQLTQEIEETLNKVEKLGTEGEVEQSRVWFDVAEKLKYEKSRIEKNIEIYNQQAKELEICQICGAFQVKGDAHQRIEEHLQGKMHLGYAQIREYLASHNIDKTNKDKQIVTSVKKEKSVDDDYQNQKNTVNETITNESTNGGVRINKIKEEVNEDENDCDYGEAWNKEQSKATDRRRNHDDPETEKKRSISKLNENDCEYGEAWNKEQSRAKERYSKHEDQPTERRESRSKPNEKDSFRGDARNKEQSRAKEKYSKYKDQPSERRESRSKPNEKDSFRGEARNKEQGRAKERHKMRDDQPTETWRNRSKPKYHNDKSHGHRNYESDRRTSRHSKSPRRSRSPMRHSRR